jgi:hypothetical protein
MRPSLVISAALALVSASSCGTADCTESFNAASQCGVVLMGGYCDLNKQDCYDCVLAAAKNNCGASGITACINGSKCK